MKIIDCFPFFNELDILRMRLELLSEHVDKFLICESDVTHSGEKKPFYYEENKDAFKKWENQIVHLKYCPDLSGLDFSRPEKFDNKDLKKFKPLDFNNIVESIIDVMDKNPDLNLFKENLEKVVKHKQWAFGKVLGLIRLSVVGNLSGPDLFKTVGLLGKKECVLRLNHVKKTLSKTQN